MPFSFTDLLFATTTALFADRLWSALLSDLPSTDLQTTWIRALIFVGLLAMFTSPYLIVRRYIPRLIDAARQYRWKRRRMDYVV